MPVKTDFQPENKAVTPAFLNCRLAAVPRLLLMLDYDGTLVPLVENPRRARPQPDLLARVHQLSRLVSCTVAVVSGRPLPELVRWFPVTGLYLCGTHGALVRHPDGSVIPLLRVEQIRPAVDRLYRLARQVTAGKAGFMLEHKGYVLAVHYRLARTTETGPVLKRLLTAAAPVIKKYGLEILTDKKVLEIRPREANKGKAVAYLRQRHPAAFPVYIGDDLTDEDAFAAVAGAGFGVLVHAGPRITRARYRLASPRDVNQLLTLLAQPPSLVVSKTLS